MRTKKILFIVLVVVLLVSAVPMAVTPAAAYEKKLPCDANENDELTKDELVAAILPYMLDEGDLKLDDIGDASWVYAYWGGKPKTIEDANEVVSTFYRPPERVIAAYVFIYVPLQIFKATDRIVGIAYGVAWSKGYEKKFDILHPPLLGLPSVGREKALDYEALLKLQPDLIFLRPGSWAGTGYNRIKELDPDLPIVCLSLTRSYDRTFYVEEIGKLGDLLDKKEEAEDFTDYYEGFLDNIIEKISDIPEEDKPRVYYEGRFGSYKKTNSELIIAVGGNDIFGGVKGSQVTAEDVIKLDPEVIFKSAWDAGYGIDDITEMKNLRDEIMSREELQNVTAVKTGRVYLIPTDLDCCGARGGRYFIAIAYIAKCLYPDLDLDPTALHQEFLTRFQGVDYDLSEHGVFVYHPEQFPEGR